MKQGAALLDCIGPPVGAFRLIPDDMGKRGLDCLPVMLGRVGRPILERGTETVRRDLITVHALQQCGEHHIRPRFSRAGQKHEFAFPARDAGQDFDAPISQRNAVRPARFHALGWNGPKPIRKVDIFPPHVPDLAGSRHREDDQFQRPRRKRFSRPESGDKFRSVNIRQCRMVPPYERPRPWQHHLKMSAPSRRVLACSMTGHASGIKNALDTRANTLRGFRVVMPDQAKRIEHGSGIDRINAGGPDTSSMRLERVAPLPPVDFAFPAWRMIGHEPLRDFGKWWGDLWGVFDRKRVNAVRNSRPSLGSLLARIGKADGIRATEAHFAALPCEPVEENPTARARIINREIQPAAVCMASSVQFPGNLASEKPVYLASHPTNYPTTCAGLPRRAAKADDICKGYIPGIVERKRTATNENEP